MSDIDYEKQENLQINEPPRSVLQFVFESPTSTIFEMHLSGVSAFQLILLSQYLEILGKNALAREAQMQEQRRLEEESRRKIITPEDVRKSIPL